MKLVASGWDCYNAMVGVQALAGGRYISFGAMPYIFQDSYHTQHEAGEGAGTRAHYLLVDTLRWLRGGRSYGTVAISTTNSGTAGLGGLTWYGPDGSTAPAVGSIAIAAIEAAGFTVLPYVATDDRVAVQAASDVLITDWGSGYYGSEGPLVGNTLASGVVDDGKGLIDLWTTSAGVRFGISTQWAYSHTGTNGNRFLPTTPWTGSESLFDRCFTADLPIGAFNGHGGRTILSSGLGGINEAEEYPSTKSVLWRNYGMTNAYGIVALYTAYDDAGVGDDWSGA